MTNEVSLEEAVAYYLYIASKDVPDDEGGLYRATALALIGKPIDKALLIEAEKKKSNDDPLYDNAIRPHVELEDVWEQHRKVGK